MILRAAGFSVMDAVGEAEKIFGLLDALEHQRLEAAPPSQSSPIRVGGQNQPPKQMVSVLVNGVKLRVDANTAEGQQMMKLGTVLPPRGG